MKFFSKKESLTQNLTFMALFSAINIIISLICAFSPIAAIFLMLLLPLTSALVAIYCKLKYFPIYAVATFGLSIVATLWNIQTTFFTVLPSIITGLIFGLISTKKLHPFWSVLIASILQAGITCAFIPLINAIFEVDIIMTFKNAFGLANSTNVNIIIPAFILTISFVQIILSYIITSNEIRKFDLDYSKTKANLLLVGIVGTLLPLSLFGFYFLSLEIAYVILIISFYFMSFAIVEFIELKYYRTLGLVGFFILMNIFIFALANINLKAGSSLLLFGVTPFCVSTISISVSFLQKKKEQIK